MKILFFTTSNISDLSYGGGKGARSRFELLKKIGEVDLYQLLKKSNSASALSLLQGHYPPLRNDIIDDVIRKCIENHYDIVFVDTSVCGMLIKELKSKIPGLPVFTQFQNCEKDFNNVRFAEKNKIKGLIYQKLVMNSEKLTLEYSDCNAVYSKRDMDRLGEIYGKNADIILPLFLKDEMNGNNLAEYEGEEGYCLLFGPTVNPNIEGFHWFVDHVSPYIKMKTVLAGKGFEDYKNEYYGKPVKVIGYVENIQKLYQRARCVCIPLFIGGGMKVKTIEALMFGKNVFGTDEAFSGYDLDYDAIGGLCNTPQQFIERINNLVENGDSSINFKSREIYEKEYSENVALKRYQDVLEWSIKEKK